MSRKIVGLFNAVSYRVPMTVNEIIYFSKYDSAYSVCPRCKKTLEREYQTYCDRCGQALSWDRFDKAKVIEK